MNNIQKAGQFFMYLFYTLLAQSILTLITFFSPEMINKKTIMILSAIFAFFFFIFLYKAARYLKESEDLENSEEEIITSGERMRRLKINPNDKES